MDSKAKAHVERFVARLDEARRHHLEATDELMAQLAAGLAAAEGAWPGVRIDESVCFAYLADRFPALEELERLLPRWAIPELRLCCAALEGDQQAVELLHRELGPVIVAALRRLGMQDALIDEVAQSVWELLLLPRGEARRGQLASYMGLGNLRNWTRVVTVRHGGRRLRRDSKLVPSGDDWIFDRVVEHETTPEMVVVKKSTREAFKATFKDALRALDPHDATLLRHRYIDGITLQEIAKIYGVHHSTVLRRLERLKGELRERTLARMMNQLGIDEEECASLVRVVQSNFDLTLQTFIGDRKGDR